MAVAVKAAPGERPVFEAAVPLALFDAPASGKVLRFSYSYAVGADGKRFLLSTPRSEAVDAPLTVVVNWLAAAKR